MSEPTVYFVNDTTTSTNWGCRGTTRALRSMVEATGATIDRTLTLHEMHTGRRWLSRVPGVSDRLAEFVAQHGRFEARALAAIRAASGRDRRDAWTAYEAIRSRWDDVPLRFAEYEPTARRVLDGECFTAQREAIEACDVVLINGEGSIYDRQRKGRTLLFLAYLATRHLDTPCALVNHTADVHDPVVREAAEHVYPLLDDVAFREPNSADACAPFLDGDATDHLVPDAAFTYAPVEATDAWERVAGREGYYSVWPDSAAGFDPAEPYVCVGGSSIYNRPDRPAYDPVPGFARLCERLRTEVAPVVLTASCGTDAEILRPVAEALDLPLVGPRTPVQQAVDVLGHADAYVGGRWHPSIYALTGGTPVVTLTANTYKTSGLVDLVDLDAPTFDALALESELDAIVDRTAEYVDRGDPFRAELHDRVERLRDDAAGNVRLLADR